MFQEKISGNRKFTCQNFLRTYQDTPKQPIYVVDLAGGQGLFSFFTAALTPPDTRFIVNDLSVDNQKGFHTNKLMLKKTEFANKVSFSLGDATTFDINHPDLIDKVRLVSSFNMQHFLSNSNTRKLYDVADHLLQPGGTFLVSATYCKANTVLFNAIKDKGMDPTQHSTYYLQTAQLSMTTNNKKQTAYAFLSIRPLSDEDPKIGKAQIIYNATRDHYLETFQETSKLFTAWDSPKTIEKHIKYFKNRKNIETISIKENVIRCLFPSDMKKMIPPSFTGQVVLIDKAGHITNNLESAQEMVSVLSKKSS